MSDSTPSTEGKAAKKTATKTPQTTRVELGTSSAGGDTPDAVKQILGGAPVPVPGMTIAPVVPTVAAPSSEDDARESNPLFDEPTAEELAAAQDIRRFRTALGKVAGAVQGAISLGKLILGEEEGEAMTDAAARERFDLKKARQVVGELESFLDRHKPPVKKG